MPSLKVLFKKNENEEDEEIVKLKRTLKDLGIDIDHKKEKKEKKDIGKTIKEIFHSFINSLEIKSPKPLMNKLFYPLREMFPQVYKNMERNLEIAGIDILPETYFSLSIATSVICGLIMGITFAKIISMLFNSNIFYTLTPFFFGIFSLLFFSLFYLYPIQLKNSLKASIDTNLPFALNHMAAIASSGIPPEKSFEMISEFEEYGGMSKECKRIVERMKIFGEDITKSIRYVARITPSKKLKDILYGLLSIIESGGDLKEYLNEMAKYTLFTYKIERKRYLESLSTYADIYTAILIVAPLFLVAILTVMNIIPGSKFGGFSIEDIMKLGIYVGIPVLNIIFLIILNATQPEM